MSSRLAIRLASLGARLHDVSMGDNPYPVAAYQRGVDLLPYFLETRLSKFSDDLLEKIVFDVIPKYRPLITMIHSCVFGGIEEWERDQI